MTDWTRRPIAWLAAAALVITGVAVALAAARVLDPVPPAQTVTANGPILVIRSADADFDAGPALIDPQTGADVSLTSALAGLTEEVASAAWSRDGRWLATIGRGGIEIIDIEGGTRHTLATCDALSPRCKDARDPRVAWSPDGSTLAVAITWRLVAVDVATGVATTLLRRDDVGAALERPSWTPDGRQIFFSRGNQLARIDADGNGYRTFGPVMAGGVLTADGASIVFVRAVVEESPGIGQDGQHLQVMNQRMRDGRFDGDPVHLANVGFCFCWPLPPTPMLSPDGTLFALEGMGPGPEGLVIGRIDASAPAENIPVRGLPIAWQPVPEPPPPP